MGLMERNSENLERIANALEGIAASQEKMLTIAEGSMAQRAPAPNPVAETALPEAAATASAAPDRDALLMECSELGIAVPRGTKTPTLVKRIEAKKAESVKPPAADADLLDDPEGADPLDTPETPKEMTREGARAELTRLVGGDAAGMSKEHRESLVKVFAQFKAKRLEDIEPENLRAVINRFRSAIGAMGPSASEASDADLL